MKHLIALTILFAACKSTHNLQAPQLDLITSDSLEPMFGTGTVMFKEILYNPVQKFDTIHEVMYVSTRVPGIGMAHYGQAIQRNGICVAHMDCRGHLLKPPVYV